MLLPGCIRVALLNSMPMGFYQPAQIVIDARKHDVDVRPIDINHSCWDNTLEESSGKYCALRLGFRQVRGIRLEDIALLVAAREKALFTSMHNLRNIGLADAALEKLADADAFRSIGLDRRQALWEVSVKERPMAIFAKEPDNGVQEEEVMLPEMSPSEHVAHDYAATSLSIKAHPVSFVREQLDQLHVIPTATLAAAKDGDDVKVAGLVLVRQRPGTAGGICFITIEDETGNANLVVFKNLFDKYRKEILQSKLLMVEGKLQIEGEVIHVIVQRCHNLSQLLRRLIPLHNEEPPLLTLSRADERVPTQDERIKKQSGVTMQGKIFPGGRNFK